MNGVTAFKCKYCSKLYARNHNCKKHEDSKCPKDPNNQHMCFWCPNLDVNEEEVSMEYYTTKFKTFFCKKRKVNLFTYKKELNDICEWMEADPDKLTIRMPSYINGCKEYDGHTI